MFQQKNNEIVIECLIDIRCNVIIDCLNDEHTEVQC